MIKYTKSKNTNLAIVAGSCLLYALISVVTLILTIELSAFIVSGMNSNEEAGMLATLFLSVVFYSLVSVFVLFDIIANIILSMDKPFTYGKFAKISKFIGLIGGIITVIFTFIAPIIFDGGTLYKILLWIVFVVAVIVFVFKCINFMRVKPIDEEKLIEDNLLIDDENV